MRVRVVVLLLGLVLAAACAGPPPAGSTVRVMTWNVQTGVHEPPEWAPVIAAQQPDVLALQEVCTDEATELAALLRRDHGLDYAVVPGPIRPPGAERDAPVNAALGPVCGTTTDDVRYGLAVLSRLPVAGSRVVTYPPDRRDEQRGALTVDVSGATSLTLTTTHLGLGGVAPDQVRRLVADVGAAPGPAIVLGDLNLPVGSLDLAPLRASLAEADPAGRHPTTDRAIDHVLVRGLSVVGEPRTPATNASDHRPLVTDLVPTG